MVSLRRLGNPAPAWCGRLDERDLCRTEPYACDQSRKLVLSNRSKPAHRHGQSPSPKDNAAAMLRRLNETTNAQGMNLPGWNLHLLKGRELKGHFSVSVSGNWRMTFTFEGTDAVLVDYQDYH